MADHRDAASTEDYWVFTPYNLEFRGANDIPARFELKHSGKDTTVQGLATTPGLPTVTTPSQSSSIATTLPGWKYGETEPTTRGLHLELQQTIYS